MCWSDKEKLNIGVDNQRWKNVKKLKREACEKMFWIKGQWMQQEQIIITIISKKFSTQFILMA